MTQPLYRKAFTTTAKAACRWHKADDWPPILEVCEHVLDLGARSKENAFIGYTDCPVGFRWHAGPGRIAGEGVTTPADVMAPLSDRNTLAGVLARSRAAASVSSLTCLDVRNSP
jgi:hypothetical protein